MIVGVVSSYYEATIRLTVSATDGQEQEIEAIIDTGFNGSLTLPFNIIATLGLRWRTRSLVTLANGAEDQCDIYVADVIWDGRRRTILVESAETDPLVGMALLYGYHVSMDVLEGGDVLIEALS